MWSGVQDGRSEDPPHEHLLPMSSDSGWKFGTKHRLVPPNTTARLRQRLASNLPSRLWMSFSAERREAGIALGPAPLAVRELGASDHAAWDRFVFDHPHGSPFHLIAWKESIEATFGYQPKYLVAGHRESGARCSAAVSGLKPVDGTAPDFIAIRRLWRHPGGFGRSSSGSAG